MSYQAKPDNTDELREQVREIGRKRQRSGICGSRRYCAERAGGLTTSLFTGSVARKGVWFLAYAANGCAANQTRPHAYQQPPEADLAK